MPDVRALVRNNIMSQMLIAQTDGATINSPFPFIRKLASVQFESDTGLIGITISSSIVNVTAGVAGIFIAQTQGDQINLTQSSSTSVPANIFISQITHQNSSVGTIAPAARTNSLAFGEATSIIPLRGGSGISIYACGDANAGNLFAAALSLYTIVL
jgi:hypothetical protein